MSSASSVPAIGSATPRMSAIPPATSSTATSGAARPGSGIPIDSKNLVVPAMPMVANFW